MVSTRRETCPVHLDHSASSAKLLKFNMQCFELLSGQPTGDETKKVAHNFTPFVRFGASPKSAGPGRYKFKVD